MPLSKRIRGMCNKADAVIDFYHSSCSQNDSTDLLFNRQLREISELVVPVLLGDSNFSDINREHHTVVTSKSGKFLKYVGDNFLSQILS